MPPNNEHASLAAKILDFVGLSWTQIQAAQKGYRNTAIPVTLHSGTMINLIIYKQEPGIAQRIKDANMIGDYAAARGLPARRTYGPRIIRLMAGKRRKYAALYNYLPGRTIPWEAYTKAHIKLLGQSLSNLHDSLRHAPHPEAGVIQEYTAIVQRMHRYFADEHVQQALEQKLLLAVKMPYFSEALHLLAAADGLKHQQPLHMDFVRSNILFNGEGDTLHISGILDFEKTAYGHPIFDVARTLAFLLVDCKYTPEEKVRTYFLDSGYRKRGTAALTNPVVHLSHRKSTLLDELLSLFLLYDFYKFLRHNPYESLPHNEHFVRTREQLLRRGLLAVVE